LSQCTTSAIAVVLSCSARSVVATEFVTADFSGQAVFEAGVLLWEAAFRRHPVHDSYPLVLNVKHDGAGTCALAADELAEAAAVGYPGEEFAVLVRDMVAMEPSTRPALAEARRRLEAMLSSTCVSDR
jgi:hypothetical protein